VSNLESSRLIHISSGQSLTQTQSGCLDDYSVNFHQYDGQLPYDQGTDQVFAPLQGDVPRYNSFLFCSDDLGSKCTNSHEQRHDRLSNLGVLPAPRARALSFYIQTLTNAENSIATNTKE